jgi:uncharacterized membrane protein YfhO
MSVTIQENMDLYMDISGGNIKQVRLYLDDQLLGTDRYQSQAFHVGYVTEGQQLTFEFLFNDDCESGTITIHAAEFQSAVWSNVYSALQKHGMEVEEFGDTYFKGTITTEDNQAVFFSIPYEEGWTVKIDGNVVPTDEVFDAFLAVEVPAGEHQIELEYVSEGFRMGVIISMLSLLFLLVFLWVIRGLKRKDSDGIVR